MPHTSNLAAKLSAVFMLAFTTPAFADRIDGEWCSRDGHQLTIKGPEITTPLGVTLQGNYGRHDFAYVAPAGDAEAGTQMYLRLLGETAMDFYRVRDGQLGEPEPWRRCELKS